MRYSVITYDRNHHCYHTCYFIIQMRQVHPTCQIHAQSSRPKYTLFQIHFHLSSEFILFSLEIECAHCPNILCTLSLNPIQETVYVRGYVKLTVNQRPRENETQGKREQ